VKKQRWLFDEKGSPLKRKQVDTSLTGYMLLSDLVSLTTEFAGYMFSYSVSKPGAVKFTNIQKPDVEEEK
jgi:hypothetical protein